MAEPTLRAKLTIAAKEYVNVYDDYFLEPVREHSRTISTSSPLGIETPPLNVIERIEYLHGEVRSLLRSIPLPEGYDITINMNAISSGALTLMVLNAKGRLVSEIYIKTNGGIRFEDPRARELDETAIMEAIDGGPERHL